MNTTTHPPRTVTLREIASARSGDKGNISNVSVWVYDPRDYEDVKAGLTVERLKAAHPALWHGAIERHELPGLHGLNFVFHEALEGGVNASLNLDAHGKSFGFLLLALPIALQERSRACS
ncbi:AtuA-related protein [Hydrogenophaga sp. OTU3427]|uniref:AtuA-related protein n=1 Tax=Hydrogenophaga sp. OTU3427 TaxID=3043856 RepID=UPI00313BE0B2